MLESVKSFKAGLAIRGRSVVEGDITFQVHVADDSLELDELTKDLRARSQTEPTDVFWAVAVDGAPLRNTIGGFARQEGYTFKVLVDELDAMERWKVADAYGVAVTPTLLLLEKGGKVLLRKGGKIREDELEKAVSSLLKK